MSFPNYIADASVAPLIEPCEWVKMEPKQRWDQLLLEQQATRENNNLDWNNNLSAPNNSSFIGFPNSNRSPSQSNWWTRFCHLLSEVFSERNSKYENPRTDVVYRECYQRLIGCPSLRLRENVHTAMRSVSSSLSTLSAHVLSSTWRLQTK